MNNDRSAPHHRTPDAFQLSDDGLVGAQAAPRRNDDSEERHKRHVRQDRKATSLDHLIRNIDIMIYCQLSVLYYME